MKNINLSISTALVLKTYSYSAADEGHEDEEPGTDVLEMSDEDFLNTQESKLNELPQEETKEEEPNEEPQEDEDNNTGDANDLSSEEPENQELEDSADSQVNDENEQEQPEHIEEDSQQPEIDYKAEWERLFSPIKASGRTIKLKNMDQVINRVQLAEDYHKKMAAMRPHLKTIKTLEKANLLGDEDELNFLLDIKERKPEAIKRLLAESGIDPLDIADEEELAKSKSYQPANHIVSDTEVAIDQVFDEISSSPSYNDTIDILANRIDPKSKEIMSEHPEYIKALNTDIENGIYDKVMDEVKYQKEMGYIPAGLSDIEAYIGTVQYLAQQEQQQYTQTQQQEVNQPTGQARPANTRQRKSMKSPGGGSKTSKKKFDPMEILEMSDEDFEREIGKDLR